MTTFIHFTIVGLAMGMIYAIMSLGFVLLVRSIGILNFAQGDLFMLGAYISYSLIMQLNLSPIAYIISAIIAFAIIGVVFMYVIWGPVKKSYWPQAPIVCTIGASYIISEACRLIWGNAPLIIPSTIKGSINIGALTISNQYIAILIYGVLVISAIYLLYEKAYLGLILQSATQDYMAATILGVPVNLTIAITYVLITLMLGFSGYLVAPLFFVSQNLAGFQVKSFAGAIIGGFGSLKGAILGSIMVGLIESYSAYFTSVYKDAFIFGTLLIVLAVRPNGLFSEKNGK